MTINKCFPSLSRQPTAIPISEITLLTVIPWFHAFGCLSLITTGTMGTRLVYLPKFEENLFLSAIEVTLPVLSKIYRSNST